MMGTHQTAGDKPAPYLLLLLAWVGVAGCGYRLVVGEGKLADGAQAVCIPVAENLTPEPAAGAWFSAALRRSASRAGVTVECSAGGWQWSSRIVGIAEFPKGISLSSGRFHTREQELTVRVELVVAKGPERRQVIPLEGQESYLAALDLRGSETSRQIALRRLIERLAEDGAGRLIQVF